MERDSALQYRRELAKLLVENPDKTSRREDLAEMRTWPEYQEARIAVHPTTQATEIQGKSIGVILPEESYTTSIENIHSPLLDFERPYEELTEEERIQVWAHSRMIAFDDLPKSTKGEQNKARKFARSVAQELLSTPSTIDSAGSIWSSYTGTEESEDGMNFTQTVKEEALQVARKEWNRMTPDQLSELTKTYTHSQLAGDIARSFLEGYFKGPNSLHSSVDAMYTYARSAIRLEDDTKALETGVKIGNVMTDIITTQHDTYRNYALARMTALDDDDLLMKAMSADIVLLDLHHLTSLQQQDVLREIHQYGKSAECQERMQSRFSRLIQRRGYDSIMNRAQQMENMHRLSLAQEIFTRESDKKFYHEWPASLMDREDNVLMQEYCESVSIRAMTAKTMNAALESLKNGEEKTPFQVSIHITDDIILELGIADTSLRNKLPDIIRSIRKLAPSNDEIREKTGHQPSNLYAQLVSGVTKFEGNGVVYAFRGSSRSESEKHPLSSIDAIGLPTIADNETLITENNRLISDIKRDQLRFLNHRGFRIPFEQKEFTDLGYEHVEYKKNSDNPLVIDVTYRIAGIDYHTKLDRDFNFDFEGKTFSAISIKEALHYATLSLLYPLLCQERLRDDTQESADLETEVISRVGHLRLLPEGQRYTQRAVNVCYENENRDLIVIDQQRKRTLQTDRYTTYVRPVVEKEEGLPPIVVNFPDAITLLNKN